MSETYAFWVTLKPQSDRCRQGETKEHILDFEITWSEFQNPSQTATEGGKAELRIPDFKTTWSEFQSPVRPLPHEMKLSYIYTILKNINSPKLVPSSCVRQHT